MTNRSNYLCRVCLSSSNDNQRIFFTNESAHETRDKSVHDLSEKIRLCGGIEVSLLFHIFRIPLIRVYMVSIKIFKDASGFRERRITGAYLYKMYLEGQRGSRTQGTMSTSGREAERIIWQSDQDW